MTITGTVVFAVCLVLGYVLFRLLLAFLPGRLKSETADQRLEIVAEARRQADVAKQELAGQLDEEFVELHEELEVALKDQAETLKLSEEDMESREQTLAAEEARIGNLEAEHKRRGIRIQEVTDEYSAACQKLEAIHKQQITGLEQASGMNATTVLENLQAEVMRERTLEAQKRLKLVTDEVDTSAPRLGGRALSRALSRYAPVFYWPKATNQVDIPTPQIRDAIGANESAILKSLAELTDRVTIELVEDPESGASTVRLAGGLGMDKEAARLTLVELVGRGMDSSRDMGREYARHREKIDRTAAQLGRQAVYELKLRDVHPEVQKMVGGLFWRTSYRQNQYYHSLEVAVLAGIVAQELGVDPEAAKRCGLMHDIGKCIDYRIDGSHAVISGDYADRFGEKRIICDTVMSHHADLIVETALAYVLRAADTLSGARPGARVNLEEGYQIRLTAINDAVQSFSNIDKMAIMSGGREVHIEVDHRRVRDADLEDLTKKIARKIEADVAFPGQIKVLLTRRFEAVSHA